MGMLDDQWTFDVETGEIKRLNSYGGTETQIIQPVRKSSGTDGGLLKAGETIFIDGDRFYYGRLGNGYGVSATNYWAWAAGGWYASTYEYNAPDLKMRRTVMEGNSRVLKAAIINMERAGRMEPLTATNYWNTYGHTLGSLNIISSYMSMAVGMSEVSGSFSGSVKVGVRKMPQFSGRSIQTLRYEAAVREAQSLFPQKAGKIELHHIRPKYLGGAKNGKLVPLDAAYHQVITNAFRKKLPYGLGWTSMSDIEWRKYAREVYSLYPLPPGYTY